MNIWRLMAHHEDSDNALKWSQQNQQIAIGWGRIGDLDKMGYQSAHEISTAIRAAYPDLNNYGHGGASLWQFYKNMQHGDLVILRGKSRDAVLEVQGNYEWNPKESSLGDYFNRRRVVVSRITPEDAWSMAAINPAVGQNTRWTLRLCGHAN